ncbi:hypothetical protein LJC64_04720 [Ruminococcaceae bacterium OttesenSCG-928-A11]|nr:hypothetical protein [Ruminococcaceae bacterium OttesenSCG-928-A11]
MKSSFKIFTVGVCVAIIALMSSITGMESVGAVNNICSKPKEDGVVWYTGNPTLVGWLDPGEVYEGTIEACNDNVEALSITAYPAPYSINQNDFYGTDFTSKGSWNKLADWISFPNGDTFTINSGQTIFIPFKITVPSNDSVIAGSQAAAIMLENNEVYGNQEESGVLSTKRFAWIVHADVNGGGLRQEGKVLSWKADGPLIFDNTNGINTYSLVENIGNVSFKAKYKLTITDSFRNNALAYEKETEKTMLPESKISNEFKWNEAPAVGWFRIREEITVFDKTETFEKMILIIPLWFIVVVVAILILLIWAIILKIRQHREKNRRLNS